MHFRLYRHQTRLRLRLTRVICFVNVSVVFLLLMSYIEAF